MFAAMQTLVPVLPPEGAVLLVLVLFAHDPLVGAQIHYIKFVGQAFLSGILSVLGLTCQDQLDDGDRDDDLLDRHITRLLEDAQELVT